MDQDASKCVGQLMLELYTPLTGIYVTRGRSEERLQSTCIHHMWGPGLSAHLHGSTVT